VAVCDVNETNRDRAASELGARGYASVEELFEKETGLDAALSCTPPAARLQVIDAATKHGVPVFVEKPPASRLEDARSIVRIAETTGVPVVVGFMYRYLPAVERLRVLVGDRPINLVQSSFLCPAATEWGIPAWFFIKEKSGGHVMDQAIHVMDLLRYIAGDITRVYTLGNNLICPRSDTFTVEDSSSTAMRFATGASGTHVHSWSHHEFTGQVTLIGKDFKLTLDLDDRVSGFVEGERVNETLAGPPAGCSHHYEEMRAFLSAARSKDFSGMRSPYTDAAKSLATVLAMNESIDSGRPVEVPLKFSEAPA